jgi:hypothetical protein
MHDFTYMSARSSCSRNKFLKNIIRTVITCIGLPFVLLRFHSFLFSILCTGIVGTGEVRPADMLPSELSGTHVGEYYVITAFFL